MFCFRFTAKSDLRTPMRIQLIAEILSEMLVFIKCTENICCISQNNLNYITIKAVNRRLECCDVRLLACNDFAEFSLFEIVSGFSSTELNFISQLPVVLFLCLSKAIVLFTAFQMRFGLTKLVAVGSR